MRSYLRSPGACPVASSQSEVIINVCDIIMLAYIISHELPFNKRALQSVSGRDSDGSNYGHIYSVLSRPPQISLVVPSSSEESPNEDATSTSLIDHVPSEVVIETTAERAESPPPLPCARTRIRDIYITPPGLARLPAINEYANQPEEEEQSEMHEELNQ